MGADRPAEPDGEGARHRGRRERVPPADRRRRQHQRHAAVRRERYREIADAYVEGLEQRLEAGGDLSHIDSVASFFVSRIDNKVDAKLPDDSPLRGRIAIANAKVAYADVYQVVFAGPRWERLKAAGANPQRALWASTSTKNPAYPATLYADELIGPDTVNTVPDATLDAFRELRPAPARTLDQIDGARAELEALADAGIDLEEITDELEREGVEQFRRPTTA